MNSKIISALLILLALASIGMIFFIPKSVSDEFGSLVYAIPVILGLLLVGAAILISRPKKDNTLVIERQQALNAIKQAETDFLQHKIDKPTFDKISQENNSKLIEVEAKIDAEKNKNLPKQEIKTNKSISSDKQAVIRGLLDQKQIKVTELKKAENSFYHRKIDEDGFKNISSKIKQEIIKIDSQIKGIQESEEIENLKEQLKEGAREIARQKKISKERSADNYMDEVEEDVFRQIDSK